MSLEHRSAGAPTRDLATWVSALKFEDLPQRTREVARIALLDTLGAGLYGFNTPWTQKLLSWVQRGGQGNEARTWNAGTATLRSADAALVNGVAVHAFELDDYHNAKLHCGAAVIPAALAVAERLDSNGRDLLTAIVAGYEVMIRSSLALNPSAARLRGWHLTGVVGPFGAAAACAVLLKLNAEETAWALGLAGTQGAGLWAFNADGSMSKRLHPGKAAHSGVLAAELAQLGFSGPTSIYEFEDGGVLKAFSDHADAALLTLDLGRVYHIDNNSIKPYCCCGSTHAYIDAALALRKKLGAPWDTSRKVRVGTCKVVDVQCGFDYVPGSVLNAQMSLRYAVAVALLEGAALPAQFTDDKLCDPLIIAVAAAIELVPDPELDKLYPKDFAGWVAVEHHGRRERIDILNPTGSIHAPINAAGITEKFRGINPSLDTDAIAGVALAIEKHSARTLLNLLTRTL
ncbi:MAG: MmgE/PrpD family protein [Betaproteobacteria bacterium]